MSIVATYCVFNEAELIAASAQIAGVAEPHGGRLEGIQFYTRHDLAHVFGTDEEE